MSVVAKPFANRGMGETSRRDRWWLTPVLTFLGLGAFIIYSTWAAFQGDHYHSGSLLSPFYSPLLFGEGPHAWFGGKPDWWPALMSPAFLILWAPGGFRFTCYYYRGAYYKSFWADPPSCAVGEPRKSYLGENSLPLILQNVHRYFMYLALIFLVFLAYDAWSALWFLGDGGEQEFGLSIGTIVLSLNVVFLGGYTLGCHSFRHLIGGKLNIFSKNPFRKSCFDCVTGLNKKHQAWAWTSLCWVGFSDVYVRLCSMGIWTDGRIF